MIEIELPVNLTTKFWVEYCDLDWGVNGRFKGFREYIKYKIPGSTVRGNIREGLFLIFNDEKEYVLFLLKWS